MDFLDPKKQKAHSRRLALGYTLIGLALLLATTILLYKAYGFDIDKDGRVIQNGLVFVSSQPSGADVYLNGQKKDQTNARLVLPAGSYTMELKLSGYRNWKRAVTIEGGSVGRFDYPFLIPTKLTSSVTKQYESARSFATQSEDRRWLLTQGSSIDHFDLFDLNAGKPASKDLEVPAGILAAGTDTKGWAALEWSDDDRHLILVRTYDKKGQSGSEYILFDRQDPTQSQNLTELLGFNPTYLEMRGKKYDQYYLYDQNARQILTANLKKPTPQPYVKEVLAFKSDGDTLLYVTGANAPAGKVLVRILQGNNTYTLRSLPANDSYLVQLAQYNGARFVAAGSKSENKVYVYKDPVGTLRSSDQNVLVPVQILKVSEPNYLSFSSNGRFAMAENGVSFAMYDAETDKGYAYTIKTPIDAPQTHAVWMDGFHLAATGNGKVQIFDFDGANAQELMPASPSYSPFFTQDYKTVYAINGQNALTATPLVNK